MAEYIISERFIEELIDSFSPPAEPFDGQTEIIRCRDCKHYQKQDELCTYFGWGGTILDSQSGEGFCAWAVRRDG